MDVFWWFVIGLVISAIAAALTFRRSADDSDVSHYEGTINYGHAHLRSVTKGQAAFGGLIIIYFLLYSAASFLYFTYLAPKSNTPAQTTQQATPQLPAEATKRIVENIDKRKAEYLYPAAAVADKYLCFTKTGNAYLPCAALAQFEKLARQFGQPGKTAYDQFERNIKSQWLPNLDGKGGILQISKDGTLKTMVENDAGYSYSVEALFSSLDDLYRDLSANNKDTFDTQISNLRRSAADTMKDIDRGSKLSTCWTLDYKGAKAKQLGC